MRLLHVLLMCCLASCSGDRAVARAPSAAQASRLTIASDCSGKQDTGHFGVDCPNKECHPPTLHVPPCPRDAAATPVGSTRFDRFEPGQVISVSGLLRQVTLLVTKMDCSNGCCNQSEAVLGVYDPVQKNLPHVVLEGDAFWCYGNVSMPCCKVDTICEEVIATGRYVPPAEDGAPRMSEASLCVRGPR